jgi:hypothetical protein
MALKKKRIRATTNYDHWFHTTWRPAMGWSYFAICLFDYIIAPVANAWFSYYTKTVYTPWVPITTQGGGLFHISMGAIIGITSYGKSQERLSINSTQYSQPAFLTTLNQPSTTTTMMTPAPAVSAPIPKTKVVPKQMPDDEK